VIELGADPHRVLGAHESEDGGVVVRAYRPEAQAVRVQPQGERAAAVEAELKDPSGLWEALLPKATLPLEYELEIEYPDGNTFTVRDPYAFLPTLGELDLHLVASGRHERLYDHIGAHPLELGGVQALLNPGSVGQPRDSDPRAAYLLLDLDARLASFRRVEYDVARTQREIREAGLPELLAARLELGI